MQNLSAQLKKANLSTHPPVFRSIAERDTVDFRSIVMDQQQQATAADVAGNSTQPRQMQAQPVQPQQPNSVTFQQLAHTVSNIQLAATSTDTIIQDLAFSV